MSQPAIEKLLGDVAARFGTRARRGKFRALCPAHADRSPSLTGTVGRAQDRVLIHCHAGCSTDQVLAAVRLELSDLFVRSSRSKPVSALRAARGLRAERREWRLGVLASKLPAYAADLLGDPEIQALFPCARPSSLGRSLRALADRLGVVRQKEGWQGRWRWMSTNSKGEPISGGHPSQTAEFSKRDGPWAVETTPPGQIRPFAKPSIAKETTKGGRPTAYVNEERRGDVLGTRGTDGKAVCRGCSRCGDARSNGLYVAVGPAYWVCKDCWKNAGAFKASWPLVGR